MSLWVIERVCLRLRPTENEIDEKNKVEFYFSSIDLLETTERNAWRYQHEEHRHHVNDDPLNREKHRDCATIEEENERHRHQEKDLKKRKVTFSSMKFVLISTLPMAVSGIAIVVVSVAIRNGP